MQNRFFVHTLVLFLLVPTLGFAQCVAVDRMAHIYTALTQFRSAPSAADTKALQTTLTRHSLKLSYADLTRELSGTGETAHIAPLIDLHIAMSVYLETARTGPARDARLFLQSPDLGHILQAAAQGIPTFHCGVPVTPIWEVGAKNAGLAANGNAQTRDNAATKTQLVGVSVGTLALVILIAAIIATVLLRLFVTRQRKEKRRARRYIVNFETQALIGETRITVRMLDVSGQGAKIQFTDPTDIEIGTRIKVKLLDGIYPATIVWANTHYVGLRFVTAFTAKQVPAVVNQSNPTKTTP